MITANSQQITTPIITLLIYIVLTYLPLIYIYLPIIGKLRIVLLSGIFLPVSYIATQNKYTNYTAYKNPIFFYWIIFLILMVFGLLVSFDRGVTLQIIEVNIKYFLVFIVMVKIIDSQKRLDIILKTLVVCGTIMAINTIYNYFFSRETLLGGYRALALDRGLFSDPNDLALLFNTTLPFALYFFMISEKNKLFLIAIITIVIAIIFTFSRGGFLGLCMSGVGFFLFFARKQKKYLFLILAIIVIFLQFASEEYLNRLSTITDWEVDPTTGMTETRLDAWQTVLAEGIKYPILGVGAGNSYYLAGGAMRDWHQVHNTFIQVIVETGVIAFIFYILLFVSPLKISKQIIRKINNTQNRSVILSKIIIISFMSYAATVFFLPQAYSPLIYTLTAINLIQMELAAKMPSNKEHL